MWTRAPDSSGAWSNFKTMKHFELKEFDSPDAPGSGVNMAPSFLSMLDAAREIAGIPFKVRSGYRTPKHNEKAGGKLNSAHLRGFAADIEALSSTERYAILKAGIEAGFRRIGVHRSFIHFDNDPSLPQGVIWMY